MRWTSKCERKRPVCVCGKVSGWGDSGTVSDWMSRLKHINHVQKASEIEWIFRYCYGFDFKIDASVALRILFNSEIKLIIIIKNPLMKVWRNEKKNVRTVDRINISSKIQFNSINKYFILPFVMYFKYMSVRHRYLASTYASPLYNLKTMFN